MNTQTCASKGLTQFKLSKLVLKNLNKFKLSPTAKLVLLSLADHYNPAKADFFPAQQTMADNLGISLASVKRAVQEISKLGLVIYETKKVNRYKFTSKFFAELKLTPEQAQNDTFNGVNLRPKHIIENKNNKKGFNNSFYVVQGQSYKSAEQTKEDLRDSFKRDDKAPMNDKETALKFISSLENQMNNPVIKMQVERVKRKWNL